MKTEQDAKSKVHLRLLGRSIGLPSEAREVIEIVWKAASEFFQAHEKMPSWIQYDPVTDVLTIHGKKYAASLFGNSGFLGNAGDILRIEQGSDDVVKVTKIGPEKSDKFATGGLRKNYIPPIAIRTGLGQNPMKPVPPVPNYSEFQTNNNSLVVALQLAKTEIESLSSVLGKGLMTDKVLTEINRALGNHRGSA